MAPVQFCIGCVFLHRTTPYIRRSSFFQSLALTPTHSRQSMAHPPNQLMTDASTQTEAECFLTSTIYTVAAPDDAAKVYVGRTQNALSLRLALHKSDAKRHRQGLVKHSCRSASIMNLGDAFITPLEEVCGTDEYITSREAFWKHEFAPLCVNANEPGTNIRNASNHRNAAILGPKCNFLQ